MRRKIVVEIEHFQLIRRLALTDYWHCGGCGTESDFVSIDVASDLFEMKASKMLDVLKISNCHLRADTKGNGLICLNSVIQPMKAEEGLTDGCSTV